MKKIIRKRKYIYNTYWKKPACMWTHAIPTCVVGGSTEFLGEEDKVSDN